jgi:hypothetical protein
MEEEAGTTQVEAGATQVASSAASATQRVREEAVALLKVIMRRGLTAPFRVAPSLIALSGWDDAVAGAAAQVFEYLLRKNKEIAQANMLIAGVNVFLSCATANLLHTHTSPARSHPLHPKAFAAAFSHIAGSSVQVRALLKGLLNGLEREARKERHEAGTLEMHAVRMEVMAQVLALLPYHSLDGPLFAMHHIAQQVPMLGTIVVQALDDLVRGRHAEEQQQQKQQDHPLHQNLPQCEGVTGGAAATTSPDSGGEAGGGVVGGIPHLAPIPEPQDTPQPKHVEEAERGEAEEGDGERHGDGDRGHADRHAAARRRSKGAEDCGGQGKAEMLERCCRLGIASALMLHLCHYLKHAYNLSDAKVRGFKADGPMGAREPAACSADTLILPPFRPKSLIFFPQPSLDDTAALEACAEELSRLMQDNALLMGRESALGVVGDEAMDKRGKGVGEAAPSLLKSGQKSAGRVKNKGKGKGKGSRRERESEEDEEEEEYDDDGGESSPTKRARGGSSGLKHHFRVQKSSKGYFEVERILEHRGSNSQREYLIRWKGYDSEHDSWQKAKDVTPDVITAYTDSLEKH